MCCCFRLGVSAFCFHCVVVCGEYRSSTVKFLFPLCVVTVIVEVISCTDCHCVTGYNALSFYLVLRYLVYFFVAGGSLAVYVSY